MDEPTSRTMSSSESLREFITERLTAAAEDIFVVFKRTIVEYEEEIDRQRRLLDVVRKPHVQLQKLDVPQQHACKEDQERKSSLDQEDPEPPSIQKKQEADTLPSTGSEHSTEQPAATGGETSVNEEEKGTDPQCRWSDVVRDAQTSTNKIGEETDTSILTSQSEEALQNQQQLLPNNTENKDSVSKKKKKAKKRKRQKMKTSENDCNQQEGEIAMTHVCEICELTFDSRAQLTNHTKTHKAEKLYPCETCGKTFSSSFLFKCHMRRHTGERPHSCSTCGKGFLNMSSLVAHNRIHTGEKPFTCVTCGVSFRIKSKLNIHMRSHTGERPYSCSTCGSTFSKMSNLNVHNRIHTGEKPFTCETCGMAFRIRARLKVHMKTHTAEKPYSCSICGMLFTQQQHLDDHAIIHTG
ncbi:zinc finger protein 664-like [Cheilinus undulatus]|uniref:zinc finger protein 664-like n=1 Tax=Cheilinus undulatus TaxID=241271 RepID=UPI001BD68347|nr:zinc finger protein 664-like [Cheilinus undulatus]